MFARTIDCLRPRCSARNRVRGRFLALIIVGIQLVYAQDGWAISPRPRFPPARNSSPAINKPGFVGEQSPALPNPQDVTQLEPGKAIEREVSGEQRHSYQITLTAGQIGNVIVEQRGIDLAVQLFSPDGASIGIFDGEISNQGEEKIELVAETAGNYRLLLRVKYPRLPSGRYQIRLMEARDATERDRLLWKARRLLTEAGRLYGASKYEEALSPADKSLELQEGILGAEHPDLARPLTNLANIYFLKGDYAKAEALYRRSLTIAEKAFGPEHPLVAQSLYNLGNIYSRKSDYVSAEQFYQRALALREKALGPDHPDVAFSLFKLANIYRDRGDFVLAEPLFQRALRVSEKASGPESEDVARSLDALASLYREKGDYAKAEPLYQRALTIWENTRKTNHPNFAATLNNLGNLYRDTGDYERAKPLYERALSIKEKTLGPNHPDMALSYDNLAGVYYAQGDYAKAESLYLSALATWEKTFGQNHLLVGLCLTNLAKLYVATNDHAKAKPLYRRALTILETVCGTNCHHLATIFIDLARMSAGEGKLPEAVAYQARANAIGEHNLALNLALGSEREKQAYLASLPEQMSQAISLHVSLAGDDPTARELAATTVLQRKGRVQDALSNILAWLRSRSSAEDQAFFDQLNEVTSQLARLALNVPQGAIPAEYQKRIKALEEEREKLESEISRRSSGFYQTSQVVTLAGVRAAIPSDAALIEYAVYRPLDLKAKDKEPTFGEPHYVVYVIRNQGVVRWAELGAAKEIDKRVDTLRQALRDPQRKDVQRLARAVDEKVMQPVRSLTADAKQLLISPDGELNLIPFAALVDEQRHYLLEGYAFNYLTSGRDLLRLQVRRESKSPTMVVADPAFGEPAVITSHGDAGHGAAGERSQLDYSQIFFGPLPGVGDEVRSLKQLLPQATFLTKEQATKAALKRVSGPRILHIATHGFFLENDPRQGKQPRTQTNDQTRLGKWVTHVENPLLRSGLALAGANQANGGNNDGVLTAFEATGLDLWGTKLVVLSACDTGIGEVKNGDGVYGLRRALVLAGSESQMMSLWAVSDHSTRALIVGYYTALLAGAGRGEALRQVQLRMLHSKSRKHPYHWAGFILSGQWAKL